jgi:hypothetical protein
MEKTKPCLNCRQTIIKRQNESLKDWINRHKFCSRTCSAIFNKSHLNGAFTKERHYIPPTAIKKGQNLSPKTQFKKGLKPWNKDKKGVMPTPWNKGKRFPQITGEKHFAWKGGISGFKHQIRELPEYKTWRLSVFVRDNATCQKCGRRRKVDDRVNLEVHHIKAFSVILLENKIKTVEDAIKCDELWDVNNAVSLCRECHKKQPTQNQHTLRSL